MESMTPTRARRNSKAPTRFNSDNSKKDANKNNFDPTLESNDQSTQSAFNLGPLNGKIKLKTVSREPLKVKLPKLKRRHSQANHRESPKSNNAEIKIHKIKLPSLNKKPKKSGNNTKNDVRESAAPKHTVDNNLNLSFSSDESPSKVSRDGLPSREHKASQMKIPDNTSKLDSSLTSKSSEGDKSSVANDDYSSDEQDSTGMEIIVEKPYVEPNDSGIKCPCGIDEDLGLMVECERCSTWQHGHCINVGDGGDAYEGYVCAYCLLPPGKAQESLCHFKVGDEFQSRFEQLENQMRKQNIQESGPVAQARMQISELSKSLVDLKRVVNSLQAKWRLLTSQKYETELRIWHNPFWSLTMQETNLPTFYIDRCKLNLESNIRNMVSKIQTRCELLLYAISLMDSNEIQTATYDNSQNSSLQSMRQTVTEVLSVTLKIKNKLKHLSIKTS